MLLYEMITGTVPFPGTTMLDVLDGITGKEPQPVASGVDESSGARVSARFQGSKYMATAPANGNALTKPDDNTPKVAGHLWSGSGMGNPTRKFSAAPAT